MANLEKAIQLSAKAHEGQIDKAGHPYILHPIRVMLAVQSEDERIAAVLHDIVEDTSTTFSDLRDAGFTDRIVEAVRALTKLEGESRIDAAHRAVANPIARQVKLADVADNLDLSRIPNPTKHDMARIAEYEKVREILLGGK